MWGKPRILANSDTRNVVEQMKTHRLARVAEVIREVASETILFEVRDPRIKMVTVTRAEVSGDLQHAKVYVSIMGSEREQQLCMYGLQRAAGFVQSKLGDRMRSRFVPVIQFVQDKGVKNSIEVSRLINEALGKKNEQSDGDVQEETETP
jgi:ribosome-binding factor A